MADDTRTLYLSPTGDDTAAGHVGTPFKTLTRARDAVREMLASGTDSRIEIILAGGTYPVHQTVVFNLQDAAPTGGRITYRAAAGEHPVLSAGEPVTNWGKPAEWPAALPAVSRPHVWVAPLPESLHTFRSLFDRHGPLPRARGKGFFPTQPDAQGRSRQGPLFTTMHFPEGALHTFRNLVDVEIGIIPTWPWEMALLPLKSVDVDHGVAETAVGAIYPLDHPRFGQFPEGSAWVENALEYLDAPGEWVLDSQNRKIYLWPRDGEEPEAILAPCLTEIIRVEGMIDSEGPEDRPVRGLTFEGLTFSHADRFPWRADRLGRGLQHDWEMFDAPTAMVRFRGAEDCQITRCRFTDAGSAGFRADLHAQQIAISGSLFCRLGGAGILFVGYGPGTKDVNRNNRIVNNVVHDIGQQIWHAPGIFLWQSGHNGVSNNLVHSIPYIAIAATGRAVWDRSGQGESSGTIRWHEIGGPILQYPQAASASEIPASSREAWKSRAAWEQREPFLHARHNLILHNRIHGAMQKLGDGNGIYISGAGTGNVIRENLIHDVLALNVNAQIRCDDDQHDTWIDRNIIWRCTGEGIISKGANRITGNIIADIHLQTPKGIPTTHHRGVFVFPAHSVAGSEVQGNIIYATDASQCLVFPGRSTLDERLDEARFENNIYWNAADTNWPEARGLVEREQSVSSRMMDPGFTDIASGRFDLPANSAAVRHGFRPIDLVPIGPQE